MDNLTVNNNPLLIVLSGPSGVGKDAVLNKMKCVCQNFHFTVTATTRPKRKGEVDGKDYIFLSRDEFEEKLKAGEYSGFRQFLQDLARIQCFRQFLLKYVQCFLRPCFPPSIHLGLGG